MNRGLLSGKYTGEEEKIQGFRANKAEWQGELFREWCAKVRSLRPMAEGYRMSIVQLVLAVTLMHPALHCAIVGVKSAEQAAEAAGVMGKSVSRQDYYAVRETLGVGR